MEDLKINIQPQAGILGVFSRLNYKPWYAIGEFVDNSTASFFQHERTMNFYRIKKITVKVTYDVDLNRLTIIDDAFGMELTDFQRAIKLDSKPDNINGRNEFGMGLKTAASWFGNVWSVESTQLGSSNKYYAKIDINKLREEHLNTINIERSDVSKEEHGTVIVIDDVTKKINAPKTQAKIKDLLSSMYRRDIKSGKVDIWFNNELLKFEDYKVLKFRNNEWKKYLDFDFDFNDKKYKVSGFVAIMEKGSFPKAGFSLFRYDRVVIGGIDENYKPNEIFGQAQSQISLKLFGELNMEDFPVNQAKDGFVWNDGLEDEFIRNLRLNILDYIQIANMSKQQRADEEEFDKPVSNKVEEEVKRSFDNIVIDDIEPRESHEQHESEENNNNLVDLFNIEMRESNNIASEIVIDSCREYTVHLNQVEIRTFQVYWKISDNSNWIEYDGEENKIVININHPFFKPYSKDEDFKVLLDKFVVAYISAEEMAKMVPNFPNVPNGYVLPSTIRSNMNKILRKLSEDGGE